MPNNFSKPTTFRIKPNIMANFELLEKILKLNKTDILDLAITNFTEKTLTNTNNHPLAKYIGSIPTVDGDNILSSIQNSKIEQKVISSQKDQKLEKAFE
jgi:hypothetical protein